MNRWQIKVTNYVALLSAGALAIIILFPHPETTLRAGAVLCLWACGVLFGIGWQLLTDHEIAERRDAAEGSQEKT